MEPLLRSAAGIMLRVLINRQHDSGGLHCDVSASVSEVDRSRGHVHDSTNDVRQLLYHANERIPLSAGRTLIYDQSRFRNRLRAAKFMDTEILVAHDDRNDGQAVQ